MDCGSLDLKAFSLGEATAAEKRAVEAHTKACGACREELSRLELTFASLGALRDEEIPRRIAFVSDKVFEPNWLQRMFAGAPGWGFAGTGLLAGALVFHAVYPRVNEGPVAAPVQQQASMTEAQMQKRIDEAVLKAVAQVEERQQELIQAAEKKYELDRQGLILAFEDQNRIARERFNQMYIKTAGLTN